MENRQWTLEEVLDAANLCGITEEQAEKFFYHYDAQGWLRANRLPIVSLRSMLSWWRVNDFALPSQPKDSVSAISARLQQEGKIP